MTLQTKITREVAATFRADWTYADWLALGMQEADKALPGGSAARKEDYARSYANSRAPVDVPRPVEPAITDAERAEWARVAAKYAPKNPKQAALEHYYSEVREDDGETDPYFTGAF